MSSKYSEYESWSLRSSYIPIMLEAFRHGTRVSFSDEEWNDTRGPTKEYFSCRLYVDDDDRIHIRVTNDERRRLIKAISHHIRVTNDERRRLIKAISQYAQFT